MGMSQFIVLKGSGLQFVKAINAIIALSHERTCSLEGAGVKHDVCRSSSVSSRRSGPVGAYDQLSLLHTHCLF